MDGGGDDGKQQPHLMLAHKLFPLSHPDVDDLGKVDLHADVLTAVKSDDMLAVYESLAVDAVLEMDATLLAEMRPRIDGEIRKLDGKCAQLFHRTVCLAGTKRMSVTVPFRRSRPFCDGSIKSTRLCGTPAVLILFLAIMQRRPLHLRSSDEGPLLDEWMIHVQHSKTSWALNHRNSPDDSCSLFKLCSCREIFLRPVWHSITARANQLGIVL